MSMKDVILPGDALTVLKTLPAESIDCVITSPPYWGLRDYGVAGQLGLERTPEEFVQKMVEVFSEIRRVLKKKGTLWLNIGDTYGQMNGRGFETNGKGRGHRNQKIAVLNHIRVATGLPPKNLVGIPWRLALALQADNWILRQDIIWHKPACVPESVQDRCTKNHEYVFLLAKSPNYVFDYEAIEEPATYADWATRLDRDSKKSYPDVLRNGVRGSKKRGEFDGKTNALPGREAFREFRTTRRKRSVWTVPTIPSKEWHFATFPEKLIEPMILAGCPRGGVILDPFMGAGTTAVVAKKLGRHYLGIELNAEYIKIAEKRIGGVTLPML